MRDLHDAASQIILTAVSMIWLFTRVG